MVRLGLRYQEFWEDGSSVGFIRASLVIFNYLPHFPRIRPQWVWFPDSFVFKSTTHPEDDDHLAEAAKAVSSTVLHSFSAVLVARLSILLVPEENHS